jgi:hypothetical protein
VRGDEVLRRGGWRIAKQTGSSAYFAVVEVTVQESGGSGADTVSVDAPLDKTVGYREALQTGVTDGLQALRTRSVMHAATAVSVIDFSGFFIDTREEEARAAACMAVINAFVGADRMPALELTDGRWVLRWPAAGG